jgi:LPS sulfotransferase NodH
MADKPSQSYVICTAPRTGSTLLAQALTSTGRAGRPHEFFDIYAHNEQFWVKSLNIGEPAEYLPKVLAAGTTDNGVFGLKLLWHQSPALLSKLQAAVPGRVNGAKALSDALLSASFETPVHYIWLRRHNKLAQAISYYRASRTGLWRSTGDPATSNAATGPEPEFDYPQIEQYARLVNHFDAQWHQFFRLNKLKILMMWYENFIANYESSVSHVLDFLGIVHDGASLPPPRLRRQADDRSAEWEERFIALAKERGAVVTRRAPLALSEAPTNAQTQEAKHERRSKTSRPAVRLDDAPTQSLIAYPLTARPPRLVKAARDREWMDATPVRFAYRCLPMVIANQSGWFILNRHKIAVTWNGGPDTGALKIDFLSGDEHRNAVSLFGCGILTFTIGYLFRTPPGFNLYVRGPANTPKDGINALEGIVESDWTEATFTMNWKVTRPNHPIVFEEGEPIAMVSPMRRHEIETFQPEFHHLTDEPELAALHVEWARSRAKHNADLRVPNSAARKEGWQRHYFRGESIRKQPTHEHQTKLALRDFTDRRKNRPATTKGSVQVPAQGPRSAD